MKYDTEFRPLSSTSINDLIEKLTYDLDLYMYKIPSSYNKPVAYFYQWKCLVLKISLHELKQNSFSIVSNNKANFFRHIKQLQGHFVIVYA